MEEENQELSRLDKIKIRIDAHNDDYRELIEIIEELQEKNEKLAKSVRKLLKQKASSEQNNYD